MKYLVLFVLLSSACAFQPGDDHEPPKFLNETDVSIDTLKEIIDFTNTLTPNGKPVNLNGYVVQVFSSTDETTHECEEKKAGVVLLGCAVPDYRLINTTWQSVSDDPTYQCDVCFQAMSAGVLAHEMGHVYYAQYEDDADPDHKHAEWFYDLDGVVRTVQNHFYNQWR
jgi:hypothetical protein